MREVQQDSIQKIAWIQTYNSANLMVNSNVSSFISTQIVMLGVVYGFELITWVWIKTLVVLPWFSRQNCWCSAGSSPPIRIIGVVPYPTLKFGRS